MRGRRGFRTQFGNVIAWPIRSLFLSCLQQLTSQLASCLSFPAVRSTCKANATALYLSSSGTSVFPTFEVTNRRIISRHPTIPASCHLTPEPTTRRKARRRLTDLFASRYGKSSRLRRASLAELDLGVPRQQRGPTRQRCEGRSALRVGGYISVLPSYSYSLGSLSSSLGPR